MHMSDALLSVAVGSTMNVVSAGTLGYSVRKIKKSDIEDQKIPMMGVMGAFVFAAQMINFTIPVTGSSGHIGGGILLAALLGPYPAVITLASVLLIQCLFFADGGLLALGCNIFNMAIIPCLVIYPLIYRPILKQKMTPRRITVAAILSVVIGLQLGAFGVVLETFVSGITELPFTTFAAIMQPIHLAIGLVEGFVTAGILLFIYQFRKDLVEGSLREYAAVRSSKKLFFIIMTVLTLITGGILSSFASANPDGLEWSILKVTGDEEIEAASKVHSSMQTVQDTTAIFPDYEPKQTGENGSGAGTGTAGVIGGLITLALVCIAGGFIALLKKLRRQPERM
jgi:cobalt/nickel transport system permease protein